MQAEILGQNSRRKSLQVYHAFRRTIKNQLIRYGRNQPLEWHLQTAGEKLRDSLEHLDTAFPAATKELREKLKTHNLDLETLLRRAITAELPS